MKRLSDYKDEEAIILWGNLIEPFAAILTNPEAKKAIQQKGVPHLKIATDLLKTCPKEVVTMLKTIDDTEEVTGVTALTRLLDVILELLNNKDFQDFFTSAGAGMLAEYGGSATANTEEG